MAQRFFSSLPSTYAFESFVSETRRRSTTTKKQQLFRCDNARAEGGVKVYRAATCTTIPLFPSIAYVLIIKKKRRYTLNCFFHGERRSDGSAGGGRGVQSYHAWPLSSYHLYPRTPAKSGRNTSYFHGPERGAEAGCTHIMHGRNRTRPVLRYRGIPFFGENDF